MNQLQNYLEEVGLTKSQSRIYLSLLKIGKGTIKEISKDCGFHRTNIYDIIEELKEKGLVTFFMEGKSSVYSAVDPKNLALLIEQKKEILNGVMPSLKSLFTSSADNISVKVYKGEEGMKITFSNIVREKRIIYYGININGQLRKMLPTFAKQFYRKMFENKIKYKGIYTEKYYLSPEYKINKKNIDIRYISSKYSTPVATHIYSDVVLIQVWAPSMIAIEIKSKQIADAYRYNFNLMWEDAKKNSS